jgi:RHS repeat-associated protein
MFIRRCSKKLVLLIFVQLIRVHYLYIKILNVARRESIEGVSVGNSSRERQSELDPRSEQESSPDSFALHTPSINLPKGGGAIRGMGEKFSANPVTGTGSMSIPIAVSPGRAGFSPQLSLTYDSGSGNGLFGFGWSLSLPQITRKTDKGLPQYRDDEESDIFILSGAEDLVPALKENGKDNWIPDNFTWEDYQIRRYRPRIEGLFALIERWSKKSNPAEVHWRTISKDNVLTIYGKDNDSRISDPLHPERIFSWLICETRDDKGNGIVYHYQEDDGSGVKLSQAYERNRGDRDDSRRRVNRYIRSIKYGNRNTLLEGNGVRPNGLSEETLKNADWMFEVVFDYDEHRITELADTHVSVPASSAWEVSNPRWQMRPDPFSSYRAGFEVRTTRRCQRVLMFHHFQELGREDNKDLYTGLVRSTDFTYTDSNKNRVDPNSAIYSFIKLVTQSSYQKASGDEYYKKSLPPVEFIYSEPRIQDDVYELRGESLENLPVGIDGVTYQWVDLDGEGPSGILTEQAGAWFYKRNLSPINEIYDGINVRLEAKFAPVELVAAKPIFSLNRQTQFLDLAGDGRPDVVQFGSVTPGFFERTMDKGWESFVAFRSLPTLDWDNPNLKFIDLDGDGHADILISEDNVFTWYPSLAEEGFDTAERVIQAWDEENGPRIVFADGTQSIYLSDMSGDGLTDIVRIRNGEVCYWPNLGYGHFGAKVTMDGSPWFDHPDLFDQKHIRLVDIDGSGTTDILYLGSHKIDIYFNLSGNGWSASHPLTTFPRIDNLASVQAFDLLGNGTACLVWGSPLPGDASRPMRYIKLMGDQKPHLLTTVKNNLGAETHITYAPSTKFYIQDRLAGNPWITKLPFPVHCVEKVTVCDGWRNTEFTTTYSYHHGYFDGPEREFRGFGRVEQVDIEDYDSFKKGNIASPYITDDHTLYQPPIKTVTWFHTGAAGDRQRILKQFEREYFYNRFPEQSSFAEKPLPEPDFAQQDLTAEEWREALRACKGMMLRQEVYELDVDALHGEGKEIPVRIYSAATHNCHIQRLQPSGDNCHAVFLVTESEALTYNYELDLRAGRLNPDPRIAHTLNLRHDEYGNPQQSIAVMYPRVRQETDSGLKDQFTLIKLVQGETHIAYTETRYTDDVLLPTPSSLSSRTPILHYRLRLPCEVLAYELTGLSYPASDPDPAKRYFSIEQLRKHDLSTRYTLSTTLKPAERVSLEPLFYHQQPKDKTPHQRLVEHVRTLFFDDFDGTKPLIEPLTLGRHGIRGLKYEDYKLALTKELLDVIFKGQSGSLSTLSANKLEWSIKNETALSRLNKPQISGYLSLAGDKERAEKAGITNLDEYWMRSGVAGFADDAAEHFYLPEEYTDPFGNLTTLKYDRRDLYIQSSTDALGNTTNVVRFDYRVLAPREMEDINGNLTEVVFDVIGMVVALAVKGGGDNLVGFEQFDLTNPPYATTFDFFNSKTLTEEPATTWLGNATTRFIYHFGDGWGKDGKFTGWMKKPAGACGIQREQHLAQNTNSQIQIALECSDGSGNIIMKKMQAEPDENKTALRWIVSGKTVLNNKGKPVKQYEPYFMTDFGCTDVNEEGVTPIMYYDAPGRLIRTEMPDGSYSRVEFSPWHTKTFDANDTALEPNNTWYARNIAGSTAQQRAARLAAGHANTPSITILDSLGREVIAIAHNKTKYSNATEVEARYVMFSKLDAEGKPLWIRDARKNLVMQYILPVKPTRAADEPDQTNIEAMPATSVPCYDIAGNLLYQHSMDAGDRWMLMDAAGKPMLAWDMNAWEEGATKFSEYRLYFTEYDASHRPVGQWLSTNGATAQKLEHFEYRDTRNFTDANGRVTNRTGLRDARSDNLLGQLVRHYDPSGRIETIRLDFKGNVKEVRRQLNKTPQQTVIDWNGREADRLAKLSTETFVQTTDYDALNRMIRQDNWHRQGTTGAVYVPVYNERGSLKSENLSIGGGTASKAIDDIRYNAKGQKTLLQLGNGTITEYTYDLDTFRLVRLVTTRPANSKRAISDIVQDLMYTYDPVGNITEITDNAYEPVFFRNQKVRPRSRYTYDALYRLIEAEGRENCSTSDAPSHKEQSSKETDFPIQPIQPTDPKALRNYRQRYLYDEVGNFLKMRHIAQGGSWTRTYDTDLQGSNRLLGTNTDKPSDATTYRYDTHGNMLNIANTDPGQQLRWDHRDMIGSLNLGAGNNWAYYQYDIGKQRTRKRIERTANNVTTIEERIYLGSYELYRRYRSNSRIEDQTTVVEEIESHHLFEGEQRVLLVDDVLQTDKRHSDGTPYAPIAHFRYQYSNHLGSACLELDDHHEIISYEEYHPYGTSAYRAAKQDIEAPPKRYRYTGMERDDESGLSYHTARHYAVWLGRWASCDPKGLSDGVNQYANCHLNPIKLKDERGTQSAPAQTSTDVPVYDPNNGVSFDRWFQSLTPEQRLKSTTVARSGGIRPPPDVGPLAAMPEKTSEDRWGELAEQQTVTYNADLPPEFRYTMKVMDNVDEANMRAKLKTINMSLELIKGGSEEVVKQSIEILAWEVGLRIAGAVATKLFGKLLENIRPTFSPKAQASRDAYEKGLINVPEGKFYTSPYKDAAEVRKGLGMPTSSSPTYGMSNFEAAHTVPQNVGENISGYSARKAETLNLPESVHRAWDNTWKPVWRDMKASGQTVTARDVQLMLENALDKLSNNILSNKAKDGIKKMINTELYSTLGLNPSTPILGPSPSLPMRINLMPMSQ